MPLFSITLSSGRQIKAVAYHQMETYEGGLAIGKHTEERVKKITLRHRQLVDLVDPVPTTVLLPQGLGEGNQSWCLPMYSVVVWFVSEPFLDSTKHGSHMAIVVYQDTLILPFSAENEALISKLTWDDIAEEFDY